MPTSKHQVPAVLDDQEYAALQQQAAAEDRSMSSVLRRALAEYLKVRQDG